MSRKTMPTAFRGMLFTRVVAIGWMSHEVTADTVVVYSALNIRAMDSRPAT